MSVKKTDLGLSKKVVKYLRHKKSRKYITVMSHSVEASLGYIIAFKEEHSDIFQFVHLL